MDPVSLPTLWFQESNAIPVVMRNASDDPVTGLANTDITVEYSRKSDSAMVGFNPSPTQWDERGRGFYALTMPGSIMNETGMFELYVAPPAATGTPFLGVTSIDKRSEIRLLEANVTGYTWPATGNAIENAQSYEVKVSPQYDYPNSIVDFVLWLEKGGQIVSNPASATIKLIKKEATGDTTVVDASSSSPDTNGKFYIRKTSTVLTANKNYSIVGTVTYNGVTYTSGDGAQSLN